jgi:hypothetical protein
MANTAVATKAPEGDLTLFNPDKALQTVVVAEASEKHWARAKDSGKLFDAIASKIKAQAEYVVWRDGKVVPSQKTGGPGRGKRVTVPGPVLPDADPGKQTAERWRKRFCHKGETGSVIDADKMGLALADAQARALRVVEQQPKGTERGTGGTGEFERYTPAFYVAAARQVLGTIDVDPASNPMAQETVKAAKYFTVDDSGLEREWHGNIWLNPPYHRKLQPLFVDKLVEEIRAGHVKQAIMLTNNSSDTEWFRIAADASTLICFTMGRVGFTTPTGEEVAPTQGQAFFYFGDDQNTFCNVFEKIGFIVKLVRNFSGEKASADE